MDGRRACAQWRVQGTATGGSKGCLGSLPSWLPPCPLHEAVWSCQAREHPRPWRQRALRPQAAAPQRQRALDGPPWAPGRRCRSSSSGSGRSKSRCWCRTARAARADWPGSGWLAAGLAGASGRSVVCQRHPALRAHLERGQGDGHGDGPVQHAALHVVGVAWQVRKTQ